MGLFDFWKRKSEAVAAEPKTAEQPGPNADQKWDDAAREQLRQSIRDLVTGEVRLNLNEPEHILESCRESLIEEEAPEEEWDEFVRFASAQIDEAIAKHAEEQRGWPAETDCDRLDRVEEDLRQRGIVLWQVSPCCDTCSNAELPDRVDVIEQRHPGFRQSLRGYAFYIEQNLPQMLAEDTNISLCMAYGWFAPEGSEVDEATYEKNALGIAAEVRDSLSQHGFDVDWNGQLARKLGLSLNWQRRARLA
jgi:hypothetical protein